MENIELDASLGYYDRYIKSKTRTYGDNINTNIHDLNVSEDNAKCESFPTISISSLFLYKSKHYLQLLLDNCFHKIVDK